jgi:hypothetical protein
MCINYGLKRFEANLFDDRFAWIISDQFGVVYYDFM